MKSLKLICAAGMAAVLCSSIASVGNAQQPPGGNGPMPGMGPQMGPMNMPQMMPGITKVGVKGVFTLTGSTLSKLSLITLKKVASAELVQIPPTTQPSGMGGMSMMMMQPSSSVMALTADKTLVVLGNQFFSVDAVTMKIVGKATLPMPASSMPGMPPGMMPGMMPGMTPGMQNMPMMPGMPDTRGSMPGGGPTQQMPGMMPGMQGDPNQQMPGMMPGMPGDPNQQMPGMGGYPNQLPGMPGDGPQQPMPGMMPGGGPQQPMPGMMPGGGPQQPMSGMMPGGGPQQPLSGMMPGGGPQQQIPMMMSMMMMRQGMQMPSSQTTIEVQGTTAYVITGSTVVAVNINNGKITGSNLPAAPKPPVRK